LLKVGKDDSVEIDFLSGDSGASGKVGFPATNTARQYEEFANKDGEVVSFKDGLRNHQLLERIANSAGWEI
jgi:hypothetical protein